MCEKPERVTVLEAMAELVRLMRKAQRDYFHSRSGFALSEAKKLERDVDALVASLDRPEGELFAECP